MSATKRRADRRWRLAAVLAIAAAVVAPVDAVASNEAELPLEPVVTKAQRSRTVGWYVSAACALTILTIVFAGAGFALRPNDAGARAKPADALQLVDVVVDKPGTAVAVRLDMDSTGASSAFVNVAVGIDAPTEPIRWAVVLCFDGPVRLTTTSTETTTLSLTDVQPDAAMTTYLLSGRTAAGTDGYSELASESSTQVVGQDVELAQLTARGLRAAAFRGPYLTIPVAAGMSDPLQTDGLAGAAPNPAQLLRALDPTVIGWVAQPARRIVEYQSNQVPARYIPDGVLPPQAATQSWYWNLALAPLSSANYSTARDPAGLAREQQDVFWSGVLLALAGSALLGLIALPLTWPSAPAPAPA